MEVKRRADFVGNFPSPGARRQLDNCVLIETHDSFLSDESTAPNSPHQPQPHSQPRPNAKPEVIDTDTISTA
jgi:hypothetical protein